MSKYVQISLNLFANMFNYVRNDLQICFKLPSNMFETSFEQVQMCLTPLIRVINTPKIIFANSTLILQFQEQFLRWSWRALRLNSPVLKLYDPRESFESGN
jgi:hypothetical protein